MQSAFIHNIVVVVVEVCRSYVVNAIFLDMQVCLTFPNAVVMKLKRGFEPGGEMAN